MRYAPIPASYEDDQRDDDIDDEEDFDEDDYDEDEEVEYDEDDLDEYGTAFGMDIKMIYELDRKECVLYPRLTMRKWLGEDEKTIKEVYIKVGDNRYSAELPTVTIMRDGDGYETDFSVLPIGLKDINVFKMIASGNYKVKIRVGQYDDVKLTKEDIRYIGKFINACERAGVFSQVALANVPNVLQPITLFNS